VKDSFDAAGLASTAGAPMFKDRVPGVDAAAVARLRAAGAVIVGKTNVPVFTGDFQAFNPVYGITRNPWDAERSPGGSSGGAAAAVAAGLAAFELGSDLGGSIRWPSHACGIFGLKTTWNLVSVWGHVPPMPERRMPRNADLVVAGPMARSAADLDLVLPVIAGPFNDPSATTPLAPPRRTVASGPARGALARRALRAGPGRCDNERAPRGRSPARGGRHRGRARPARHPLRGSLRGVLAPQPRHRGLFPAPEGARSPAARGGGFAPGDLSHRALQAKGARMTPGLYQQVKARKQRMEALWARFFERYDVVLCPPAPVVAIPHDPSPDFHARTLDIDGTPKPYLDFLVWASLATSADLPAAVAPVMRNPQGLPSGVQIIAARGEDRTAVAVAGMLEALGCRYEAPPLTSAIV
jgi:amidase